MSYDSERLAAVIARYGDLPVARLGPDDLLVVVTPNADGEPDRIARELAAVGMTNRTVVFGGGVRVVAVSADLLEPEPCGHVYWAAGCSYCARQEAAATTAMDRPTRPQGDDRA